MTLPRRCAVTGNPCGTDTRPVDHPCQCDACMAHAEIERLRAALRYISQRASYGIVTPGQKEMAKMADDALAASAEEERVA
jgi:hypothetical protein